MIASFFSGIGGLELGLEWAGLGPTVFQCENDPYALRVLERRWPGVERHDDITTLDPGRIPAADVWCGGFPCQDISLAGKGAGLDGERSGLWWAWYERIRVVRPRVLVVENVAAFAARGLGDVLGALAQLGYDAEWHRLGACDVGAPHRRLRIFLIAWRPDAVGDPVCQRRRGRSGLDAEQGRAQPQAGGDVPDPLGDALRQQPGRERGARGPACAAQPGGDGSPWVVADADGRGREGVGVQEHRVEQGPRGGLADRLGAGRPGRGAHLPDADEPGLAERPRERGDACQEQPSPERGDWWSSEPDVGRVATGVPARVDRLRCLGNSVVPRCAWYVGLRVRQILEAP